MTPAYQLLCEMFAHRGFQIRRGLSSKQNLYGTFDVPSSHPFEKYWADVEFENRHFAEGHQDDIVLLLNEVVRETEE